ncbi:MAG TPA: BTAD domain-containing putative transcriptional regulator [Fimbriimonadaceae bacterium]|nr:BTAD domain-containing putative transcriptional regulator [Fimbriimonadaceae bacterium]
MSAVAARYTQATHATSDRSPDALNSVRICVLGALTVIGDEAVELTFRTRKTTALFTYLALRAGQRHSRDFLCELFWPDSDAAASRLSLRVALSSLRKSLGDAVGSDSMLRVDGDLVWIDEACHVDAVEFERLYQYAASIEELDARMPALEAALAAYAGPLVPGCDEALLEAERMRLTEMAARLLRRKGQTLYRMRSFAAALEAAEASLELDPDAEAAYRIAIRCDMAEGRQDSAARRYRQLESRLMLEARTPEPKTLRLGQELLTGRIGTPIEPAEPRALPQDELPQPLTPFFGRADEIERLAALLTEPLPSVRLITLLGLGGSGKTRLAVELARRAEEGGAAHVAWLALAGRRSVAEVRTAIASAFDVDGGSKSLAAELTRRIGDDTVVLVLDNLEHLIALEPDAVRELAVELLEATPRLRILGASRVPLEVPGEMRYVVPMLPMPEANTTAAAAKGVPAVQLFVDRARRRRADFELDETNVADISEIVTRLDGMPLALELAAIWVTALSPAALVQRLNDRFELLASGEADIEARHKRLESVIEASVDRLPDECLGLYLNLCVLPDAATLEVAQAVGGLKSPLQTAALITVLVERALARRERRPNYDGEQFFIPECLREYGAARLGRERRHAAMERTVDFVSQAIADAKEVGHSDLLRASRDVRPLMPIIEGVLAWCEQEGTAELGMRLATAWPALWSLTNRQLVGRDVLARFLALGNGAPDLRATANIVASRLSLEAGEIHASEPFVRDLVSRLDTLDFSARHQAIDLDCNVQGFTLNREALAKNRELLEAMYDGAPTDRDRVQILAAIAGTLGDVGERELACEMGEEVVAMARRFSGRFQLGEILAGHAFNLTCIRANNRAEAAILESIDIARESNHINGLAHRLWIYGEVIHPRDRKRAREVWQESLLYHREVNNRQGILWVLGNLGISDLEDQLFDRAEPLLRERLRLAKALNDTGAIHQTFRYLVRIAIARRDWAAAEALAADRHGFAVPRAVAALELGWLAEQAGRREEATAHYRRAVEQAEDLPDLAVLARLCLREPAPDEQAVREALDRLDGTSVSALVPTSSEIVDQAIRSVRLRHTLTAL